MCVCVCVMGMFRGLVSVFVCVLGRFRGRVSVCVCVCVWVGLGVEIVQGYRI